MVLYNSKKDKFLRKIIIEGDIDTYRKYLSATKDEDDINGDSLLHVAVFHGREKIVELLLSSGADLEEKNNHGQTPIQMVFKRLVKLENNWDLLRSKKINDVKIPPEDLRILNSLLNAGADVNVKDRVGKTLLHLSAIFPRLEIYTSLKSNGALGLINALDLKGETPLHYAVYFENTQIVEALVADKARIDVKDNEGKTALHMALSKNNHKIAKILLYAGADVKSSGNRGQTSLHLASWKGDIELIKYLMFRRADVNVKDIDGQTPLHWAVMFKTNNKNKPEVVELLLRNQADSRTLDNAGKKPVDYLKEEASQVLELLCGHEKSLPPSYAEVEAEFLKKLRDKNPRDARITEEVNEDGKDKKTHNKIFRFFKQFKTSSSRSNNFD